MIQCIDVCYTDKLQLKIKKNENIKISKGMRMDTGGFLIG